MKVSHADTQFSTQRIDKTKTGRKNTVPARIVFFINTTFRIKNNYTNFVKLQLISKYE